jgi:hypothetical protein
VYCKNIISFQPSGKPVKLQVHFKEVAQRKASNGIEFLRNLTGLGRILIIDTLMTGYFIIPTGYMSERYGIAGDVWQCKPKDLLTVCTKDLQEITARNEKLINKLGYRQFCKDLNKCSFKFYGVFIICVQ